MVIYRRPIEVKRSECLCLSRIGARRLHDRWRPTPSGTSSLQPGEPVRYQSCTTRDDGLKSTRCGYSRRLSRMRLAADV